MVAVAAMAAAAVAAAVAERAHLEELGQKLNHEADLSSFLRMVNWNHLFKFNSSNYSLSSLFSLDSVSGSIGGSSSKGVITCLFN